MQLPLFVRIKVTEHELYLWEVSSEIAAVTKSKSKLCSMTLPDCAQHSIHLDNSNRVEGQPPAPIEHTQVPIIQDVVYHPKLSSNLHTVHKHSHVISVHGILRYACMSTEVADKVLEQVVDIHHNIINL